MYLFAGDGESSAYSTLLEQKPYDDTTVEKRNCVNHLKKNLNGKLLELRKNSKYPLNLRRIICEESGKSDITGHIVKAVVHWQQQKDSREDKLTHLRRDIRSSAFHVLGNHTYCM